ncbi:hypothetical protein OROGR_011900 [Orobanche gracilis]
MFSTIWSKKKDSCLGSSSSSSSSSSCKGSDDEGLRLILTKPANGNSNQVVVKHKLPSFMQMNDHHHHLSYCYLKSCHLCHKSLNLDREIYMYMGDMGFCSVECRDRQIYLDEKKEVRRNFRPENFVIFSAAQPPRQQCRVFS